MQGNYPPSRRVRRNRETAIVIRDWFGKVCRENGGKAFLGDQRLSAACANFLIMSDIGVVNYVHKFKKGFKSQN
jgi:hypothetical protein